MTAITTTARAFIKTLNLCKGFEKVRTAIVLNKGSKLKIDFKIGDRVAFYLPPTAEQQNG